MTLRLGFVGVGPWAMKLKAAFEAVGCAVVGYDRSTAFVARGWGEYRNWSAMAHAQDVDALVLCAPPEATTAIALRCAALGKPCMATKPLMLEDPPRITAPLYVDFWRLYSEAYAAFKREADVCPDDAILVRLAGSGPVRGFPGVLDYGPHALAFLLDLMGRLGRYDALYRPSAVAGGELLDVYGTQGREWHMRVGSGSTVGERTLHLDGECAGVGSLVEEPDWLRFSGGGFSVNEPKAEALKSFCRAFVRDVQKGIVDPRLLRLSCDGMKHLRAMRWLARKAREP